MMEITTKNADEEYTIRAVLEALKNMDSQYGEELLNNVKVSDLSMFMNDKDLLNNYIKEINNNIAKLEVIVCGFHLLEKELAHPKVESVNILKQFEELTNEEKKQTSIDLYNDKDFQNNLCLIVLDVIKTNVPEATGIFKALGIDFEKYMREAILLGKGYKAYIPHKEVAS